MKKLFVFCLLLFIPLFLISKTGIIKKGCSLRDSKIFKQSKQIGVVEKEAKVEILDSFADWAYAKAKDKKTQKEYKGYLWQGGISKTTNDNYVVIGKGLTLNKYPKKSVDKKDIVAYLWPGSEVKIIKWLTTWYEISEKFGRGWVYKDYIDVEK